jgi:putative ABC transport system permease protein
LKGDVSFFRRALVVVQFSLSVILIGGTFVLNQQLSYLQNKSLGYQKEQTAIIPVGLGGPEGQALTERFRNAVAGQKDVLGVAASAFPFAGGGWGDMGFSDDQKVYRECKFNTVDPYFLPTYGIKLVAGRNFDPKNSADNFGSIIVNQAFVKKFGWTNPLNERLPGKFPAHRVIGVTEDFHYASLHDKVEPLILMMQSDSIFRGIENLMYQSSPSPDLSVRLSAGNMVEKVAMLAQTWKRVAPNEPLRFTFLDADLQRQYEAEQRLGRIVTIASMLSILIACLGLFGLATLAVVRRTKEIGVRKVLGASTWSVVSLLSKDFLKLVAVAIVVASPIAWWATDKWLNGFEYRIGMPWWAFILAGVLALLVAFLTVSFQSMKAALMNPVTSLKTE